MLNASGLCLNNAAMHLANATTHLQIIRMSDGPTLIVLKQWFTFPTRGSGPD